MKTNRNIHTSSCLQCNPCGSGCTIVDNRISFVFDSEKKHFSHLLFDPTPVACMQMRQVLSSRISLGAGG